MRVGVQVQKVKVFLIKKVKEHGRIIILTVIISAVFLPLALYVWKFGSWDFSQQFETWVSFANYWSPFLTLATAVFTGIIAYQALIHNEKVEAPLITFEMVKVGDKQYYIIKNAGKVPAVNCLLLIKETGSEQEWDQLINCYVIKPDEVKVISWIPRLGKARMHYENFSGEHYTTTIQDQRNNFTRLPVPDSNGKIVKSYSDLSRQKLEDEVLKSLSSSSENKDDFKMVVDLLLNKAKECNQTYLVKRNKIVGYDHRVYSSCLNEIIITLQILTTLTDSIGTVYITERERDLLKIFWIQLHVGIRSYVKDCYANKLANFPTHIHKMHLDTMHTTFSAFYEEY